MKQSQYSERIGIAVAMTISAVILFPLVWCLAEWNGHYEFNNSRLVMVGLPALVIAAPVIAWIYAIAGEAQEPQPGTPKKKKKPSRYGHYIE